MSDNIETEFKQIQKSDNFDKKKFSLSIKHTHGNRYNNVLANDDTIFPPENEGHYLNANIFKKNKFYDAPHEFVCSQAPLPTQFIDFWTVIYRHRIPVIVMLTKCRENGMNKAHRYYPKDEDNSIMPLENRFVLKLLDITYDKENKIIFRKIQIIPDECENGDFKNENVNNNNNFNINEQNQNVVLHIQYLDWPDHGVPNENSFRKLINLVRETSSEEGPILVHCSAGIGRTGTFIAVYYGLLLIERYKNDDKNNNNQLPITRSTVVDIVKKLKETRTGMVQTSQQLEFIYSVLGVL